MGVRPQMHTNLGPLADQFGSPSWSIYNVGKQYVESYTVTFLKNV